MDRGTFWLILGDEDVPVKLGERVLHHGSAISIDLPRGCRNGDVLCFQVDGDRLILLGRIRSYLLNIPTGEVTADDLNLICAEIEQLVKKGTELLDRAQTDLNRAERLLNVTALDVSSQKDEESLIPFVDEPGISDPGRRKKRNQN